MIYSSNSYRIKERKKSFGHSLLESSILTPFLLHRHKTSFDGGQGK